MTRISIDTIRQEFPAAARMLYLDSAHQTPMPMCVRAALHEFMVEGHESAGPKPVWMERVESARARVADLLHAHANEIAFTKNTSEGLNIAANAIPLRPGDTVLMLAGDHPNHAYAWLNLVRKGIHVRFVPLEDDQIADASTFAPHLNSSVKVIALSHISFHAGQVHDIAAIGRLCAQHNLYLVVDAMQSVGVLPVDVQELGVSVLAAGTHKGLLLPQGLGFLYVRRDLQALQPAYLAMAGLAHPPADYIARPDNLVLHADARRFELGNYNLPHLHALGRALEWIEGVGINAIAQHVRDLGERLMAALDDLGVSLVGPRPRAQRAHIYVLRLDTDAWCAYFAQQNVRVSPERGGVRISFGMFNTVDDVDRVVQRIAQRLSQG